MKTQPYWNRVLVILFSIIFSAAIMCSTFSYKDNSIVIGTKIWSDFWANIPLIRSFSFGDNIPPEYPLFPGERIRYHFLFFFLVGMLERIGIRIDIALNILSIIGFSGMMIGIYALAKHFSHSKIAGWLALILFIFNSSFSWIYYLDRGINTLPEIVTYSDYPSHGPYDDSVVSGFWKLNVYVNQRHLAFAFAILAFSVWSIVYSKSKYWKFLGIFLLISLSWLHKAVLLMAFLVLGAMFLTQQKKRKIILGAILVTVALSLPGIQYLNGNGVTTEKAISFHPGFIYNATSWHEFSFHLSNFQKWLVYWLLNLGILPLTAFLGWIWFTLETIAPKKGLKKLIAFWQSDRVVWFGVAVTIFAIANLFQFASDLGTNHKFINFTQIIFSVYSACLLWKLWKTRLSLLVPILLVLLTLGGIFDFFPLFNDPKVFWEDIPKNIEAQWIYTNTAPNSIFLNTTYNYNPIVTAGRKVFWGWDYFTSSIGYPLAERRTQLRPIIAGEISEIELCKFLYTNKIRYIFVDTDEHAEPFLNTPVNRHYFTELFGENSQSFDHSIIYDTTPTCQNATSL